MAFSPYRILIAALLLPAALGLNPGFPYGSQKVRGVNLGGWLVLEPWITPSLFDKTGNPNIVDEWTFGQYQDKTTAKTALKKHWDTWITEGDFIDIAAAGLNHVRVPIGYWAFEVAPGEPYIQGQLPYLTKAVDWAAKHGLKVIVDLHGAPGSQNGFDNSGQRKNYPQWHTDGKNIARTNAIIKVIADMFKDQVSTVPAIAPLNEPAGFYGNDVLAATRNYWESSYRDIRFPYGDDRRSDTISMIHDAFQPLRYWDGFQAPPRYEGVIMDTHQYQVFSNEGNRMSQDQHIRTACDKASELASFHLWTVVGEWCPASTDCARYLNGRGVGARYDGTFRDSPRVGSCSGFTGDGSKFSPDYKTFLRKYWEAQVQAYEQGSGWIQWTWKAEEADDWSYQAGLRHGWIPQDPTDLKYPSICQ